MTAATQLYDANGPLPGPGILVLEASAGTGKTHAIKVLVRRFIEEGVASLDEMLIMTFSRSATAELRTRVRQELREYSADERNDPAARAAVRSALSDFDAASIATIHQSCIDAFARLGIAADAEPDEVIAEQVKDLLQQVVAEVYLGRFVDFPAPPEPPPGAKADDPVPTPDVARAIASAVVNNPDAVLIPLGPAPDPMTPAAQRAAERMVIAEMIRSRFPARQRRQGLVSFDDVVLRLADAVTNDEHARRNLGDRFKVVLVDEFQDTDPSQWAIINTAFAARPDRRVILIGDPKQGIYSFRGADIHSYAAARNHPGAVVATLGTNYRSDDAVVRGLLELLGGLNLGGQDPADEIIVGPVTAAQQESRLTGGPAGDARRVRIRCLPGEKLKRDAAEALIVADLADEIVADLHSGRRWAGPTGPRQLLPSDFAVIVPRNDQAELVRSTLVARGVPAVVNSRTTVFVSQAAADWVALLAALEQPRPGNVRAVALTPFFGVPAADLAAEQESATARCAEQVRDAAAAFAVGGIPAVTARFTGGGSGDGIAERMLATPDGERYLTDLRHVSALLHRQQRQERLGLSGLLAWLEEQIRTATTADSEDSAESLVRRIDTDADAVQVVTIHSAKGLQYPITYVPFSWGAPPNANSIPVATVNGKRTLDVRGIDDATKKDLSARAKADLRAESLRMLYVALTRGISEVVVWWAHVDRNSSSSPLQRVILARAKGTPLPAQSCSPIHHPAKVFAGSQLIAVEDVAADCGLVWSGTSAGAAPALQAAPYTRSRSRPTDPAPEDPVDTAWSRPSFSGLTRGTRHRPGEAEADPIETGAKDDDDDGTRPAAEPVAAAALPSPLAGIAGGRTFGDLVHRVLEHVDFAAHDVDADLLASCTEQLRRGPVAGVSPQDLAVGLAPALRTSLGGEFSAVTLAGIAARDRLAELEFELALGSGRPPATVGDLGRIVAAHAADPWLAGYGAALGRSDFSWKGLRGFLTGSIDAVLRIDGRFVVVDYKSNVVGPRDGDVGHYAGGPLRAAMDAAHYPLQALLYCVALHRFLGWRLPGYDPATHLGGVRYLFLRGMAGPGTPVLSGWPAGVFGFDPGPELVLALDDAMGGGR